MDLMEAMQILPGKNTNKKLREIIFAHQEGRLSELLPNPEDTSIVIDKVIDVSKGEIPLNKAFDQQKADKAADDFLNGPSKPKEETSTNKYGLEIPPFDKGQSREFSTVKAIFNKMMYVSPQITTPRYMELAQNLGLLEKYSDKEKFCRDATIAEINLLLDAN